MDHCATIWPRKVTVLLAVMCFHALVAPAECDERRNEPRGEPQEPANAEALEAPWQYPEDEQQWVSPLPDDAEPPGRMLSGLPQHPFRHFGMGEPLQGTSWLNRPYYVGVFGGSWLGANLLPGEVDQGAGFMGGYWLGTDLNHYWGSELRGSLFYVNALYSGDESQPSESRNLVGDVNLLYYPWGDARWRPYGSLGLGIAGFHFVDSDNGSVNHTGLQIPIGFGFKYLCRNWLAVRLDIKDNVVFGGNGVNTTSNWSFLGGVEVHWGAKTSARYRPW